MKLLSLLLIFPLLACPQTQANLKGPVQPPAAQAQVPKDFVEVIHLGAGLVFVNGTYTFTLAKQPAPNTAIRLDYIGGLYGSNTATVVFPDATQTLPNQKVLVITVPTVPPAGFGPNDNIIITYKTLDPIP